MLCVCVWEGGKREREKGIEIFLISNLKKNSHVENIQEESLKTD